MVKYVLSISELAKLKNVTSETLRHYDRIGLLKPDYTSESGRRYYSIRQYERLGTILELRQAGMSLNMIQEYLDNRNFQKSLSMLEEYQREFERKLQEQMQLNEALLRKPDYQDMIAKEAAAGHTVAIHSASHDYQKIYQSTDAYMADLYEMNDIIKAQTGKGADIIRFPGGASNTVSAKYCKGIMTQLVSLGETNGFQYCDWNISSGDAGETKDTDDVYNNVISGIQKHKVSVVLQHDIKKFSVDAVERIIQWGQANGYTFLPLTPTTEMVHHKVNN